jgi:tRNA-binding protein
LPVLETRCRCLESVTCSLSKKEDGFPEIIWEDFEKVDVRVGTVVEAKPFPEARKPSIKLIVDFGPEVGTRNTSAQLTAHYEPEGLVGKQVVAVITFPPRRIAGFQSEVLVLGVPDGNEAVVLLSPDHEVPPGGRMF